ncbi:MAG: peptidoglycan-associated lipoprotein Pal [Myxococcota bacterium]
MNKVHALLVVALVAASGCKKKPPAEVAPVPAPAAPAAPATPEYVDTLLKNFNLVYFDTDSSALNEESKAVLEGNVQVLQEHPDVKVQIQGHADERGTEDYNLALGNKRADAVREYLVNAGVSDARLSVLSYGEERPAVSGRNETAWSKNRRAEFVISW